MFLPLPPLTGAALVGIVCAWFLTVQELRAAQALTRSQKIALLSVLAASLRVVLFFTVPFLDRRREFPNPPRPSAIGRIAVIEVLLFLVFAPCDFARRGLPRWWLALASLVFLGGQDSSVGSVEFASERPLSEWAASSPL
ncbi:MAG TPA: hypothetical protein VME18_11480 [Acidobacteriaceae bacterium]|nr:hypothetical protein [Acidobacteriaceae bacterium]